LWKKAAEQLSAGFGLVGAVAADAEAGTTAAIRPAVARARARRVLRMEITEV
jgi:hypothetical protein